MFLVHFRWIQREAFSFGGAVWFLGILDTCTLWSLWVISLIAAAVDVCVLDRSDIGSSRPLAMETIVVVEQHRNHSYSRCRHVGSPKFGSPSTRKFREINCRTFQSGAGILPTPLKQFSASGSKISCCCISPQPLSPCMNAYSEDPKHFVSPMKTASLPIGIKASKRERPFDEDFSYSELWAGPAYSNSPPPSSLPIPNFSLQQKRAASLDLPRSAPVIKLHSFAKSAPSSPTRESSVSSRDLFLSDDSATQILRRMLNLDITD